MSKRKQAQVEEERHVEEHGEEEEGPSYEEIDKLLNQGINAADVQKLKTAGIYTVNGLTMRTKKELIEIKGLSEAKVEKIIEAAGKITNCGFVLATDYMMRRKQVIKISTGSKNLDALLGGGIETMSITEAFGEFRTGKTQIAHTLCVTAQLPLDMGGGNGKVAFIDTEGTFRPDRIGPIADRFGVSREETLDNILFARAYTHDQQMNLVTEIAAKMVEDQFRLIIVDSVTALFRVDFSGRGELAERQQKLGKFMSKLMKLAEEFNVAIYISNQVVSDPGGGSMFISDPKKPIGGHILAHASTTRLSLRKGRAEQRVCKIYDSPCLPENEAVYEINEGGIIDSKE